MFDTHIIHRTIHRQLSKSGSVQSRMQSGFVGFHHILAVKLHSQAVVKSVIHRFIYRM
jgi:hypothetical protein